jgi:pyruvate dehydrogenase E1 component alpha subunit/2-oxoisovalerate dehydrogenase E1 component alpha subunit
VSSEQFLSFTADPSLLDSLTIIDMKKETRRKAAPVETVKASDGNGKAAASAAGGNDAAAGNAAAAAAIAAGGKLSCVNETTLKPEQLLELYRYLKLTRMVEERLVNLYRQTKVVGGVFRSLGQEATAVGTAFALAPQDFITPLIRDLGAVLVKGIRPREIFAQYMAKAWGPSGGRDLNIHFGNIEKGFIGPISHLGDMIPVMTGVLLAGRMQQKEIVALAYIGDGGMSTGAFHEGLNFAAVQRLPLIVVAEYNHYAYSTPTSKQTAVKDLAEKAAGYGIPGHIVDGNDILACYEVTRKAAEFARAGGGAVLIEAKTYRRKGHAEHDDQRYVSQEEIEWWEKNNDPVDRYERYLTEQGTATPAKLAEITAEIQREIDEDVAWAESSPMPEPEQAAYGVFDNSVVAPAFRPKVLEK